MAAPRPPLFDRACDRIRRDRARRLAGDRFLDRAAAAGLAERLSAVNRRFSQGLLIGRDIPEELSALADSWTAADFDLQEGLPVQPGTFDVAISLYSLQAIDDLPGALIQIRRALRPDGLFLGALFGGGTLNELRASFAFAESETLGGISPRVAPMADVRDLGALLQRAGFALPVADTEKLLVRYGGIERLAHDLRAHGQGNTLGGRRRTFLRRATLAALGAHYAAHFGEPDGRLRASFETVYLTGWSPHESQQKPLRPGSAKARLADALGTVERKAGEPTFRKILPEPR